MNPFKITLTIFILLVLAAVVTGIVKNNYLWYIRAGIFGVGAVVYWLLIKRKARLGR